MLTRKETKRPRCIQAVRFPCSPSRTLPHGANTHANAHFRAHTYHHSHSHIISHTVTCASTHTNNTYFLHTHTIFTCVRPHTRAGKCTLARIHTRNISHATHSRAGIRTHTHAHVHTLFTHTHAHLHPLARNKVAAL